MTAARDSGVNVVVHEQIKRFAALRSAQRALAPSVRDAERLFPREQVREMLAQLRALSQGKLAAEEASSEAEGADSAAALREVDERLDGIASQLLDALDQVSLAQLRATLPATAQTYPEEVLALLNLCAAGARGHTQRLRVVEYLLTLLASELRDGVRSLSQNPDEIIRGVSLLCCANRDKFKSDFDPDDIALQFRSAVVRLHDKADIQPTLAQIRTLKADLAEAIFLPEIVRDALAYNIAVWNRQEELLDAERTSDRIAEADLLFCAEVDFEYEEEEAVAAGRPADEPRSIAEVAETQAAGIARIEAAIGRVIRGEEPDSDLPGLLTLELDPDTLSVHERGAFVGESDDLSAQVIRSILATAVVLQQLPEGGERLREINLSPVVMQGDWIRHLSQEVQQTMRKLVADSRYEDARALSAIKHQYLYSSLTDLIRERQQELASSGASAPVWVEGYGEALSRAVSESGPLRRRVTRELKRPANYVGLLLVVLAASAVFRIAVVQPRNIEIFTAQEISRFAPFVASGYRSKSGLSPLFIGTVNHQWHRLSEEEQRLQGIEFGKRLGYTGVDEVMLFDTRRKLVLHFVENEIRYPKSLRE